MVYHFAKEERRCGVMAKYGDIDKAIDKLQSTCIRCIDYLNCTHCHIDKVIKELKSIPTADVVEVVRCKDCKHSSFVKSCSKYECRKGCGTLKYCNDFCSYGERRETDAE